MRDLLKSRDRQPSATGWGQGTVMEMASHHLIAPREPGGPQHELLPRWHSPLVLLLPRAEQQLPSFRGEARLTAFFQPTIARAGGAGEDPWPVISNHAKGLAGNIFKQMSCVLTEFQ